MACDRSVGCRWYPLLTPVICLLRVYLYRRSPARVLRMDALECVTRSCVPSQKPPRYPLCLGR
ncbi:hypothetical protein LZ31DRAFT_381909 [Colletotrichum somersetense]|nr:hypothetical protein LZ31DRAFT_381909 [Colletotrichum somersetense]